MTKDKQRCDHRRMTQGQYDREHRLNVVVQCWIKKTGPGEAVSRTVYLELPRGPAANVKRVKRQAAIRVARAYLCPYAELIFPLKEDEAYRFARCGRYVGKIEVVEILISRTGGTELKVS